MMKTRDSVDDTMLQWLLEKKMKTNMSHKQDSKLKETNWIKHLQNDQKPKEVDAPFLSTSLNYLPYLLTSHVVRVDDSGLSFLVSCRLLGQNLFGSIEVCLGATGLALDVGLRSHAMLRDLPTCPSKMRIA